MADTYRIIFHKAGDGSPAAMQTVAERIATATRSPVDKILKQIEAAPFIYKRGLPKAKAEAIAATLEKLGAATTVQTDPAEPASPPPAPPAAAPAGGFDFASPMGSTGAGAPAAPPAAGFDFGFGAAPASPTAGFGAAAPSAGFGGFGGPAPTPTPAPTPKHESSGDFSIEAPSASPSAGGFDFSMSAAVAGPGPSAAPAAPAVQVERNEDFGANERSAPPVQKGGGKKGKPAVELVTCPRCATEQPPANECSSCGVVMAKAGAEAAPSTARRPRRSPVKKSLPVLPIAIVAGLLVVAAGAWFGGLLNPWRLNMAIAADPILKAAGVNVAPPTGRYAIAVVTNEGTKADILNGLVAESDRIDAEISRLSALDDRAQFETGRLALETSVDAYLNHPARDIFKRAGRAVATLYPVTATAIAIDGRTYMPSESIEVSGADAEPLLNGVAIRQKTEQAAKLVAERERERIERYLRETINVSFSDPFDQGLAERWGAPEGGTVAVVGGRLEVPASAETRLMIPEPQADYNVEVVVSGATGSSRGGLVLYQDDASFLSLTQSGNAAQVTLDGADRASGAAAREARLRIVHQGPVYELFTWDPARNGWARIDRVERVWDSAKTRHLGLVARGGDTLRFDNFVLNVAP